MAWPRENLKRLECLEVHGAIVYELSMVTQVMVDFGPGSFSLYEGGRIRGIVNFPLGSILVFKEVEVVFLEK
jgi:hypothetical protein